MSYVKLCRMATELVSGAEVGRRLGVSREAVRQWRGQPGFPEPLAQVGRSMVWDWRVVEAWAVGAGRSQRPAAGAPNGSRRAL